MRNERRIPVEEETQPSMGVETDATKEVDASFFNSLTSAFKNDVLAAVKNTDQGCQAGIKGQINQLEKTLSDQIGALKPLIFQRKGEPSKQPHDDGGAVMKHISATFEKTRKAALEDKYEASALLLQ